MSAQNGDTVMQEDALDQEEELAFGKKKLITVSIFHSFYLACVASLTAFVMVII
jgi:hypothetical protein